MQDIHKKRTILAAFLIAAALALLLFLVGLDVWKSQKEAAFAHSELSMGTVVTAQLYGPRGENASAALFSAFDTLEREPEFPGVWSPQKLPKLTPLPDPPCPSASKPLPTCEEPLR